MKTMWTLALVVVAFVGIPSCGGRTGGAAGSPADSGSPMDGGYTVDAGIIDHPDAGDSADVSDATADSGAGASPADSGMADSSVTDSGILTYDGPPTEGADAAPPVGSPACEDQPCVLCSDGYYHCHQSVYPQCPIGVSTGQNCAAYNIPSYGCFTCGADGDGYLWQCASGAWDLGSFACTP
jgi:hypothetical protein